MQYSQQKSGECGAKQCYDQLEATQRGTLDVRPWLSWFLACLLRTVQGADGVLASVLDKAQFWQR